MKIIDHGSEAIMLIREDESKMSWLKKARIASGIGWYSSLALGLIEEIPKMPQLPLEPGSRPAIAFGVGMLSCISIHYTTGKIMGKTWDDAPEEVIVAPVPEPVYAHVRSYDVHGALVEDVSLIEAMERSQRFRQSTPRVYHPSGI